MMNSSQEKFLDLMYRFQKEFEFSEIYEISITKHDDDDFHIAIFDKRDDSLFFEFLDVLEYDDFIDKLNKYCDVSTDSYEDYRMLKSDLFKILREDKIKELLGE